MYKKGKKKDFVFLVTVCVNRTLEMTGIWVKQGDSIQTKCYRIATELFSF